MLQVKWNFISGLEPSDQVDKVHEFLENLVDNNFPTKTVKFTNKDKPFMTKELKTIDRRRKKEWKKYGKSEKYKNLDVELKSKFKKRLHQNI